jgi:hypothetical protein
VGGTIVRTRNQKLSNNKVAYSEYGVGKFCGFFILKAKYFLKIAIIFSSKKKYQAIEKLEV